METADIWVRMDKDGPPTWMRAENLIGSVWEPESKKVNSEMPEGHQPADLGLEDVSTGTGGRRLCMQCGGQGPQSFLDSFLSILYLQFS
jgi:hypothetical protein